jgi:hypothetical protein
VVEEAFVKSFGSYKAVRAAENDWSQICGGGAVRSWSRNCNTLSFLSSFILVVTDRAIAISFKLQAPKYSHNFVAKRRTKMRLKYSYS